MISPFCPHLGKYCRSSPHPPKTQMTTPRPPHGQIRTSPYGGWGDAWGRWVFPLRFLGRVLGVRFFSISVSPCWVYPTTAPPSTHPLRPKSRPNPPIGPFQDLLMAMAYKPAVLFGLGASGVPIGTAHQVPMGGLSLVIGQAYTVYCISL